MEQTAATRQEVAQATERLARAFERLDRLLAGGQATPRLPDGTEAAALAAQLQALGQEHEQLQRQHREALQALKHSQRNGYEAQEQVRVAHTLLDSVIGRVEGLLEETP